jgi:uncharacterized protein
MKRLIKKSGHRKTMNQLPINKNGLLNIMNVDFQILKEKVLKMLENDSNPLYAYHSVDHTMEVLCNCERIALEEGVTDERQLLLLKIAALYHDTGFLFVYKGHEEKSCELVRRDLSNTDLSAEEIEAICSMIMSTKIPQSPKNHLEEIICDADLDYLGRDDFGLISDNLRKEYFKLGFVKTEAEWIDVQVRFIGVHQYFTKSTREKRSFKKLKHLQSLKRKAGLYLMNKL